MSFSGFFMSREKQNTVISNNVKNKFFNIRCINWGSLLTRQTSSYGVSDIHFILVVSFGIQILAITKYNNILQV